MTESLFRDVVVRGEAGLHARPAALFCRLAGQFESEVFVEKGGVSAPARSLLSVLQLDVRQGDTVTLRASGGDASEALRGLAESLETA